MLMSADAVARWHLLEEHHDWGDRHAEHQRLQGRTGWRHLRNLDHQQGRAGRSACRGKRISGPEEEFRSMFCSSGPGPRQAKRLLVSGCRAEIYGGCFYVAGESEFAAPLLLRDCEADGSGRCHLRPNRARGAADQLQPLQSPDFRVPRARLRPCKARQRDSCHRV